MKCLPVAMQHRIARQRERSPHPLVTLVEQPLRLIVEKYPQHLKVLGIERLYEFQARLNRLTQSQPLRPAEILGKSHVQD